MIHKWSRNEVEVNDHYVVPLVGDIIARGHVLKNMKFWHLCCRYVSPDQAYTDTIFLPDCYHWQAHTIVFQ